MFKNQLQELAQKSCFNLPYYTCIREGPDHAPRFKAIVNVNGKNFKSPNYCTTLKQAEYSAAEVALNEFARRGPTNFLAAKILDETGIYKNLIQEISQRVDASLPTYKSFRSGPRHSPLFTCTVKLAGITFTGEPAKTKKQSEKNAAMAAWSTLKILTQETKSASLEKANKKEEEHVVVAQALKKFLINARSSNIQFPTSFPAPKETPTMHPPPSTSRILPLIYPKTEAPRTRPLPPSTNKTSTSTIGEKTTNTETQKISMPLLSPAMVRPLKFYSTERAPHIPNSHFGAHCGMASPVAIRNVVPVFSAPPTRVTPQVMRPPRQLHLSPPAQHLAPPVCVRQVAPVYCVPPPILADVSASNVSIGTSTTAPSALLVYGKDVAASEVKDNLSKSLKTEGLDELKI